MNNNIAKNGQMVALVVGGLCIVLGLVWLVQLAFDDSTSARQDERVAVPADPTPQVTPVSDGQGRDLTLRVLIDDDMGTGSPEFSAVTLNEDLDRLLIADDEGRIFEFELQPNGEPVVPPRRTIQVRLGPGDIEGIAWLAGNRYAIADEADGVIRVVELNDPAQIIDESVVLLEVDTKISGSEGSGIEGVSYTNNSLVDDRWVTVIERPATLVTFDRDGERLRSTPLDLLDASDVWASDTGVYSVLSDEGRVIVDLDFGAPGEPVRTGTRIALIFDGGRFEQPEGLVRSRDGSRLYVVGESPGPGQYVFGLWTE